MRATNFMNNLNKVYVIRHGESVANVAYGDHYNPKNFDAQLTAKGL